MYMVPLSFVKIGQNVAVCATRIVAIMSTASYQARQAIKNERKAGTLINACGRDPVKCAVFLDNGSVVASPTSVQRLLTAIQKSSSKEMSPRKISSTNKIEVYDVQVDSVEDYDLELPEEDDCTLLEDIDGEQPIDIDI